MYGQVGLASLANSLYLRDFLYLILQNCTLDLLQNFLPFGKA